MKTIFKNTSLFVMAALAVVVSSVDAQAGCGNRSYGHHYNYHRPICRTPIIIHKPVVVVRPRLIATPPRVVVPVQQVVIVPQPLQMAAIHFVDPGLAAEGVGPRYRVTIKNISPAPIHRVFDIVLAAGVDPHFSPKLPQASQRVVVMAPGAIVHLDIRLPVACLAMKFPGEDRPAPFSHLFVMVAKKDLLGNVSLDKLALVPRIGLPMVDLAIARPAGNVAPVGAKVQLSGEGFGLQPGRIILELPGLKLNARVLDWNALGVTLQLPELALAAPAAARLVVIRSDGQTAPAIPVKLVPAVPVKLVPAVPVIEVPAVPVNPAPVSPAPVGPAPVGPAPVGPAPVGPAPVGPAPAVAPAAAPFQVVQPQATQPQAAPAQPQQTFGVLAPQGQPAQTASAQPSQSAAPFVIQPNQGGQ